MSNSKIQVPRIKKSKDLPNPTYYVQALKGEFSQWAFDEERCLEFKGKWREAVFKNQDSSPIDLEIGTGNGFHFSHYAANNPTRNLIGMELKFKPLIQSIRRALNNGCKNARIIRYDAAFPENLFGENELDNVFIHFPDPWPKKRQKKNRLIQPDFLEKMFKIQRTGSVLEFKTDSRDYFDEAVEKFKQGPYKITGISYDLHNSEFAENNFVTHFESIFLKKGQPIHYISMIKEP